jgi:predicted oxidoreductase
LRLQHHGILNPVPYLARNLLREGLGGGEDDVDSRVVEQEGAGFAGLALAGEWFAVEDELEAGGVADANFDFFVGPDGSACRGD